MEFKPIFLAISGHNWPFHDFWGYFWGYKILGFENTPQMLTIQVIKNAKPGDKLRKLYDGNGLYLAVTPSGGKLWRAKYRVDGREKTLSLGPYPQVGLAEARQQWAEARRDDDPSAMKLSKKMSSRKSSAPTFLEVATEWHTRQSSGWTKKHASQVWRSLEINIIPSLGLDP